MTKEQVAGVCRLCKSHGFLVNSHIIPRFQYKPLKPTKGRVYMEMTDPSKKTIPVQNGIKEYLFCHYCDNVRISRYENHLARFLFGGLHISWKSFGPIRVFMGYDYKLLKNAFLSILWRMSLSSHSYFNKIQLTDEHEEQLRLALLNNTEFLEEEYPVLVVAIFSGEKHQTHWMLSPDSIEINGDRIFRCPIAGFLLTYFVGLTARPNRVPQFILRRDGFPITELDVTKIPFVMDAYTNLINALSKRQRITSVTY